MFRRVRRLLGHTVSPRADQELEREIAHHLALETERNIALGLDPAAARRQAHLAFGALEAMKETHRDERRGQWLEVLRRDIRHAVRGLRRHPVMAITAIVTLALAIGANTAIYSVVNAVILQPLPLHDPDRLVMLWEENADRGWHQNVVAPANYLDWQAGTPALREMAAYMAYSDPRTLTGTPDPVLLGVSSVTGNFFSVLGVPPALGRGFTDEETWRSAAPVAVISHRLWQTRFGGTPDVLGRTLQLNTRDYQIVGVMPASFGFPERGRDVWLPLRWDAAQRAQVGFRRAHMLRAVGRLAPGVTLEAASAQLQTVVKRLERDHPETNVRMGAGMTPLHAFLIGDTRTPLLILLGAVAILLLIACANVGNLLLVQAANRGREAALRLALGASRGRLLRQAMTGSLVLSCCGGLLGIALGWVGTRILGAMQPGLIPLEDIPIDWSVVGYVVLITTLSGILFGLAPMFWTGRRAPGDLLRQSGRAHTAGVMRGWRRVLVVAEVALALLLTLGAGLLVRSFQRLQQVQPGFDPVGVLAVTMNIPSARYDTPERMSGFYAELLDRIRGIPGVSSAATASSLPLGGGVGWTSDFTARGRAPDDFGSEVAHRAVSPDYFGTMRVPVLRGRAFTQGDGYGGEPVVVINDALARSYFRDTDPIGQLIAFDRVPDSASVWRRIVGVVGDEHQAALATRTQIEIITPELQSPSTFANVMIRTSRDPATLIPLVREQLRSVDGAIALTSAQSMEDVRRQSMATARFLMILLFTFALVGAVLAAVGVYGVMASVAGGRLREMGIRMALGASRRGVQWLVVREGVRLTVFGLGAGLLGAWLAIGTMLPLLYEVTPRDPVTFAAATLLLALTAIVATWLPARRASRTDPVTSLRGD